MDCKLTALLLLLLPLSLFLQTAKADVASATVFTGLQLVDAVLLFGAQGGEERVLLGTNVSMANISMAFPPAVPNLPPGRLPYESGTLVITGGPLGSTGPTLYLDTAMRCNLTPQFPAASGRAILQLTNFSM